MDGGGRAMQEQLPRYEAHHVRRKDALRSSAHPTKTRLDFYMICWRYQIKIKFIRIKKQIILFILFAFICVYLRT